MIVADGIGLITESNNADNVRTAFSSSFILCFLLFFFMVERIIGDYMDSSPGLIPLSSIALNSGAAYFFPISTNFSKL